MQARRIAAALAAGGMIATGAALMAAPGAAADAVCDDPPAPYVDWSDCDKANSSLPGANLTGATLVRTFLQDSNLTGANLTGANLTEAYLPYASLPGANLTGANLTGAYLAGANMAGVNLTGADVSNAFVDSANLAGAIVNCGTGGVLGTRVSELPAALPAGWTLVAGTLTAPVVACTAASVGNGPLPSPWMQSYAREGRSEACATGWSPSYAEWPNAGVGGWVCDRTLAYDATSGTWNVR